MLFRLKNVKVIKTVNKKKKESILKLRLCWNKEHKSMKA